MDNAFLRLAVTQWCPLTVPVIPPGAELLPSSSIGADAIGKAPGIRAGNGQWTGLQGWQAHKTQPADAMRYAAMGANLGLRCGSLVGIDIDVDEPAAANAADAIIAELLGPSPIRYRRNSSRRLRLYRVTNGGRPWRKVTVEVEGGKVELLGEGQQFVAYGKHPSGADLEWMDWPAQPGGVPEASWDALGALIDRLQGLGGGKVSKAPAASSGGRRKYVAGDPDGTAPVELVEAAVEALPCNEATAPTREAWAGIVGAIWAATLGAGLGIAEGWASRWDGPSREGAWAVEGKAWSSFGEGTGMAAPELFTLAERHGWDGGEALQRWRDGRAAASFDPVEPEAVPGDRLPHPDGGSDEMIAREALSRMGGALRYSSESEAGWMMYRGGRWASVATAGLGAVQAALSARADSLAGSEDDDDKKQAELKKFRMRLRSLVLANTVASMIKPWIETPAAAFDADGRLLNTPGGIIDLRTGEVLPHSPSHLMQRQTRVAPAAGGCPRFLVFIDQLRPDDAGLRPWLKRAVGMTLLGEGKAEALFVLFGCGSNGKSTLIKILKYILGSYAASVSMENLMQQKHSAHPEWLARLHGVRMVAASEVDTGSKWNVGLIKQLTGGDEVTARFMRQGGFDFRPVFTLWLAGNHKPRIGTADTAIERRMNLIHITQSFLPDTAPDPSEEGTARRPQDPKLYDKLVAEAGAILQWAIEGCAEYLASGLGPRPASVQADTAHYMAEGDPLWVAFNEVTEAGGPAARAPLVEVVKRLNEELKLKGEPEVPISSPKRFTSMLDRTGIKTVQDDRRIDGKRKRDTFIAGRRLRGAQAVLDVVGDDDDDDKGGGLF